VCYQFGVAMPPATTTTPRATCRDTQTHSSDYEYLKRFLAHAASLLTCFLWLYYVTLMAGIIFSAFNGQFALAKIVKCEATLRGTCSSRPFFCAVISRVWN